MASGYKFTYQNATVDLSDVYMEKYYMLNSSGILFAIGSNGSGRLGDNTTTSRSSPVQTIAGGTSWAKVSTGGGGFSAAIKSDGTLWLWGIGTNGQLGDGTYTSKSSPVQIFGAGSWASVSAGQYHAAAVKTDGTIYCWGFSGDCRLGFRDTNLESYISPMPNISAATNWSKVSCGYAHSAAIKTDGSLWSWGVNSSGQLGEGSTYGYCNLFDARVNQEITASYDWDQAECGRAHTAAIKTNGTLWMWGYNGLGTLGDGTATDRSSPVQTIGSNWKQVSTLYHHTAAVKHDGTLWCWGYNSNGQLGDNTTINRSSPVQTVAGGTDWYAVSCGYFHTIAIKKNGTVYCWGDNGSGQFGNNSTTGCSSPIQTISQSKWKSIDGGNSISLLILSSDT